LVRARQVHRSIVVETRGLDAKEAEKWKIKAENYDSKITKMTQDIERAETLVDTAGGATQEAVENDMSAKQMTQVALKTQDKSMATTSKIKNVLEETIEIGTATAAELSKQGDQITGIRANIDTVESNVSRANKQLTIFIKYALIDLITGGKGKIRFL
jgi:hypothetical protein